MHSSAPGKRGFCLQEEELISKVRMNASHIDVLAEHVSDLVREHDRRRHSNRTIPVVIQVSQNMSESLHLIH